jgi:hypothetical protein
MFQLQYSILEDLEKIKRELPEGLGEDQVKLTALISDIQIEKAKRVVKERIKEYEVGKQDQRRAEQRQFESELLRHISEIARNTRDIQWI